MSKKILITFVVFLASFWFVFVDEAWAEWVSPTGHNDPDNAWSDEPYAYDGDIRTRAYNGSTSPGNYSAFLELTFPQKTISKVREYIFTYGFSWYVDIDVYDDSWHNCWEGTRTSSYQWVEHDCGALYNATKIRIRAYQTASGNVFRLNEVQVWEQIIEPPSPEEMCVKPEPDGWNNWDTTCYTKIYFEDPMPGSGLETCGYSIISGGEEGLVDYELCGACSGESEYTCYVPMTIGEGEECRHAGEGACKVKAYAWDIAGNPTAETQPYNIEEVNIPPVSTIYRWDGATYVDDPGDSWQKAAFTRYIYDYDEDGDIVSCTYAVIDFIENVTTVPETARSVTCENNAFNPAGGTTITVGDGKNCPSQGRNACGLYVRCEDDDGEWSEYDTATYHIDWTPPVVGETSPTTAEAGIAQAYSATVSDNLEVGYCWLYVEGENKDSMTISPSPCQDGENCTASKEYTFPDGGTYSMYARCCDHYEPQIFNFLNCTSGEPVNVEVTANNPPVITDYGYTTSPCEVPTTQSEPLEEKCQVYFYVEAYDPDGDPLTYDWNLGDGTFTDIQNPIHHYPTADTYNVLVTVSDGRGGVATEGLTLNVTDPTLWVDLKAEPSSGVAPLYDVDLTATVSGTMTGTIYYKFDCTNDGEWDLAIDDTTVNPYTAADLCDYPTAGSYLAKVFVERGEGSAEKKTSIKVTDEPEPPPPECDPDLEGEDCKEYYGDECGYGKCGPYERPVWSCPEGQCEYYCEYDPVCEDDIPECEKRQPKVTIEPKKQAGEAGTQLAYEVTIANQHWGQDCPSVSPFSLSRDCPPGPGVWECSFDQFEDQPTLNLGIDLGRSATTTIWVTSPIPFNPEDVGDYGFTVIAETGGAKTILFMSTAAHSGGNFGGRSGADAFCNNNKPPGLTSDNTSNIHALLCVSGTDEVRDMPSVYGYNLNEPLYWYNTDTGELVQFVSDWADFLDGTINVSPAIGTGVNATYWTGCRQDGSVSWNCDAWTSSNGWAGNCTRDTTHRGDPNAVNCGHYLRAKAQNPTAACKLAGIYCNYSDYCESSICNATRRLLCSAEYVTTLTGSDSAIYTVVAHNDPPVAAIACHPQGCAQPEGACSGYTGTGFCLKNNSWDLQGDDDIVESVWTIEKGGELFWGPNLCPSTNILCNWTMPDTFGRGNYTAYLEVTDQAGESDTASKDFTILQDAVADFMCSLTNEPGSWQDCDGFAVLEGERVYFKDDPDLPYHSTASDGAEITNRAWTFKDGTPSSVSGETNPSAVFEAADLTSGKVTLTITDSAGRTASAEHQLSITVPLPEWIEIPPF